MVSLASQGKRVVRLKGGDPLIFGPRRRGTGRLQGGGNFRRDRARISAAQGAASRLGISLTDRKHARRLQYITGHAQSGQLPNDIDWRALADPTTTTGDLYAGAYARRAGDARAGEGLDPNTPAAAIARATRPDQGVVASAIGELPARLARADLPGPVLVNDRRASGRRLSCARTGSRAASSAGLGRRPASASLSDNYLRKGLADMRARAGA